MLEAKVDEGSLLVFIWLTVLLLVVVPVSRITKLVDD